MGLTPIYINELDGVCYIAGHYLYLLFTKPRAVMALTEENKLEIINRIEDAIEVAVSKFTEYTKLNLSDNAYRAHIQVNLENYQTRVGTLLNAHTLDYQTTITMVEDECEFWESVLDKL